MTLGDETDRQRQLLAIGSILHFARDGAVVWGAGVNGKISPTAHKFHHLDVRAVRGPLTREFLIRRGISVPAIYGDPALLLPHLTSHRFAATRLLGPAFVPNLHDLPALKDIDLAGVPVIAPTQSWNRCVNAILGHSLMLSSSLHGIIIAEAYGIPARYVRLTQHEHLYKYEDYYAGTGRPAFAYARSLAEGVEMGGERPPIFDPQPLLDAFPFDLWIPEQTA
jgi:pyruvyltransferase